MVSELLQTTPSRDWNVELALQEPGGRGLRAVGTQDLTTPSSSGSGKVEPVEEGVVVVGARVAPAAR
ncbi:hypothetical protein [Sphaerisporangium rhizosphaerae]|uniref:Uncharacterized protein n=1 Tax=Sphaerisporangium rhizosphaerae TaxID=2269375 RepID=A0ABW2P6D5_9ACTN